MTAPSGNGPPLDVPPSELWAAITQLPRPYRLVDFPAKDPHGNSVGQVAIWPLTQEELMICAANAARAAKELLKEELTNQPQLAYEKIYQDACACEILARACRDVKSAPEFNRPAFPAPREVRKKLSQDQIMVLTGLYLRVEREVGPILATMSADEEEAWIGRLAQAGNVFPIVSLSREVLENLALSLALRLRGFSMGTSSPGTPPPDGEKSDKAPEPSTSPGSEKTPEFVDEFAQ